MSIKSFTDLIVWQKGHALVLEIYKITSFFPKEELYGLTSQIKRAIISVTSNIWRTQNKMAGFCHSRESGNPG